MKVSCVVIDKGIVSCGDRNIKVFDVPVRRDILHRTVVCQDVLRHRGTHAVKQIGDVSGTTKKPHNQKGSGRARLGSKRAPQCRKGGVVFGPVVRHKRCKQNKKERRLALRMSIRDKINNGMMFFVDDLGGSMNKTSSVLAELKKHNLSLSTLFVVENGEEHSEFARSLRNVHKMDVLPECALNVKDILNHDKLVFATGAFESYQERVLKYGKCS